MAEAINPGLVSTPAEVPFAHPSDPNSEPYGNIRTPEHVSTGKWQESFYDPTSHAPVSQFCKLDSGPLDIRTGRPTGEGFATAQTNPVQAAMREPGTPQRASFEQV